MTDSEATTSSSYAFEQPGQPADARYDGLAALYDEATKRHIVARGIGPGWRCLDVGAGGGSVAAWLSEQVGPTGHVLATDLNTDSLERVRAGNLEVRRHDIVSDPLPEAVFDLIHTRLVLVHLPSRDEVVQRLIGALKPGGWLVLEEFGGRVGALMVGGSAALETPLIEAMRRVLIASGADPSYGLRLPDHLRSLGLRGVGTEGRVVHWPGGAGPTNVNRTNALHMRSAIIEAGLLTEDEFERELARLEDPAFSAPAPVMWSVWGQRP
jgi:SAM-dependent methyltransferase